MKDNWSPDTLLPEYIKHFQAYVPSKPDDELMALYGCSFLHRLNNNENPLGPPPAAQNVMSNFPPSKASLYPSGDSYHLRRRLADRFGKHHEQFLVGNGANEVISFVIKAFCQQGDNIVTADKTFAVYEWVAEFSGVEPRLVPLRDMAFDSQAMLAKIDSRTKALFLCNPNNPTGTYWNQDQLSHFLDMVDGRCIVVVDEAYCEFVEAEDYPNAMSMIDAYPYLVVFRTFSKMYGLASLRIGYLAASQELVSAIRRACVVYSVNAVAQEAALAALSEEAHVVATRHMVREGKEMLRRELTKLKLPITVGEGNFIMVKLPINDAIAYRRLMRQGVMVRTMTSFRFPNYIRITVSKLEALEAFVAGLRKILSKT